MRKGSVEARGQFYNLRRRTKFLPCKSRYDDGGAGSFERQVTGASDVE